MSFVRDSALIVASILHEKLIDLSDALLGLVEESGVQVIVMG